MRAIAVVSFAAAAALLAVAVPAVAQTADPVRVAVMEKCIAQARAAHPEETESVQRLRAGAYYACMTAAGQRP